MTRTFSVLALVSFAGCFAAHGDDPLSSPAPTDGPFVGEWQVSSALGWALSPTVTDYGFGEAGTIEVLGHTEGHYLEGEAGQWSYGTPGRGAASCAFGDRWWTEGEELLIESECDDGSTDLLRLVAVPEEPANAFSSALQVVGPPGAVGYWESGFGPGFIRRRSSE